jgi:hypothetical protein
LIARRETRSGANAKGVLASVRELNETQTNPRFDFNQNIHVTVFALILASIGTEKSESFQAIAPREFWFFPPQNLQYFGSCFHGAISPAGASLDASIIAAAEKLQNLLVKAVARLGASYRFSTCSY